MIKVPSAKSLKRRKSTSESETTGASRILSFIRHFYDLLGRRRARWFAHCADSAFSWASVVAVEVVLAGTVWVPVVGV